MQWDHVYLCDVLLSNKGNHGFLRVSSGKGSQIVVHRTVSAGSLIKCWHLSSWFKPSNCITAAGGRSGQKRLSRNTKHFLGCSHTVHSFEICLLFVAAMESFCTQDAWDKLIPRPMCQGSCRAENFLSQEGMVKKTFAMNYTLPRREKGMRGMI